MAFSQSVQKGQVPVCCNLCEVEVKISCKCLDCDLLMCNKCKDRIHPKIKNAKNHKVIDIKEVGQHTEEVDFSNIKCKVHKNKVCVMFCKSCDQLVCTQCIAKIHNGHGLVEISEGYQIHIEMLKEGQNEMTTDIDTLTKTEYEISQYNVGSLQHISTDITFQVIKEYTTDIISVFHMSPCVDSLWISDVDVLQKVQPEVNNLKVISSFDMKVYGIAVTPSNDLLIIRGSGSVLKKMNTSTGEMNDTIYSIDPVVVSVVHVTSDYKVVMGGYNYKESSGVVIMMDKEGKHKTIFEYDRNNQPLFSYPRSITSTNNGNICVVDKLSSDNRGRVVVLAQGGDILNIYNGHPVINNEETPFKPLTIGTTPEDNIVVPDLDIYGLHILNNEGHLITHINTQNNGIKRPYSIAFTRTGKVYIGCGSFDVYIACGSFDKAKLYEVQLLGC